MTILTMSNNREEKTEKNKELLLLAMEKHLGIVSAACNDVGLSRETYYKYYNNDKNFKDKIDALNEYTLDFVEAQLLKQIKSGSERSILFYMRYKGKKRGYTDSLDITTGGNAITEIKLIQIKKDDTEH